GNLPYIAPEVLRLDRFTPKADIYSLGMLMYEILTGFPPFHDRVHDCHLAIDIVSGIRPTIPPDLPDTLKYLMEQCWDNNPEARPTSAKL
ncbi:kinase-like protein, partial [Rhizophagus irregularis]